MTPTLGILFAMLAFWLGLGLWIILTYNGLVRSRNKVDEGFSTMDVYLQKRHDLVPNLVQTVKGSAAHEAKTLQAVIKARNSAAKAESFEEKLVSEDKLSRSLGNLFAVAESYPDLKANAGFQELQRQLDEIEDDIANARKYYNGCVRQYMDKMSVFPSNFIAAVFNFKKRYLFEIENDKARKAVKVDFEK